jgi:hypothetical protein
MWRARTAIVLGTVACVAALLAAGANAQKNEIAGGIEGKVKKVDVDSKTLTITTAQGRERTFTITDETIMLGPRGGKVRRRLRDPRFHEGLAVTVVAEKNTASEVHLGYDREERDADKIGKTDEGQPRRKVTRPPDTEKRGDQTSRKQDTASGSRSKAAGKTEHDEEDNEVPGKVKRFDVTRRILVVTLLNGKDRSFVLSKDVPVLVKGKASKQGLEDPALKAGAPIEVLTDEGGHKVKELKIVAASQLRKTG